MRIGNVDAAVRPHVDSLRPADGDVGHLQLAHVRAVLREALDAAGEIQDVQDPVRGERDAARMVEGAWGGPSWPAPGLEANGRALGRAGQAGPGEHAAGEEQGNEEAEGAYMHGCRYSLPLILFE